jgi:hypothetical protein
MTNRIRGISESTEYPVADGHIEPRTIYHTGLVYYDLKFDSSAVQ